MYVLHGKSEKVSDCVVFVVSLKSLFANVTADTLICVVVYALFFATHERLVLLL